MHRLRIISFLIALALWATSAHALADVPTLAGTWNATAMRSDWSIGAWGPPCGPTPSGGGAPGGSVTITSAGNELHFSGAGRDYSTGECWEQFPGLSRMSHAGGVRGWKNTCKTKPGDPRQATLVTTVSATDTSIAFDETGQYQFVINGQNCTASVRRTRTYLLVHREGDALPAAPSASAVTTPATPTNNNCALPGPPERLEVRPARKLMRPGESFEFHAAVLDSAGCALGLSPVWKIVTQNTNLELTAPGKIHVPDDAPEATIELQAALAGRAARVTVEVASQERYDALLAQNGLNPAGESNDAAVARIATTAIGGGSVVARDDSQRRRVLFVGVVGGSAFVLGLLGFALVQRSRRKPVPPPEPMRAPRVRLAPAVTPNGVPPLGKICPTCREEYPPEATFCPNDGNRLVASRGSAEPAGPSGGVCPVCGQGYDPGISSCPKHGEELVPAAVYVGMHASEAAVTKKICPVCGKQYAGESQFCGGCGASLVQVN
jgi:hypothetical protein